MHCRTLGLLALGGLLAACSDPASQTGPQFAKGGPHGDGGSTDIPVTTTLTDVGSSSADSFEIRSDGVEEYPNSSTLTSIIQAIGDWVLDEVNPRGATRQVYLGFGRPMAGTLPGGGTPAFSSGLFQVRMISKCTRYGNTMQELTPGSSMTCPLHIGFSRDGNEYAIQMNPTDGDPEGTYPETEPVTITCTSPATGSGPCVTWSITPSANDDEGKAANIGKLIQITRAKGKTVRADLGDFWFSFSFLVSNP